MVDQTSDRTVIAVGRERLLETLLDMSSYTKWARAVREAKVLERDEEGRAVLVAFTAAAVGRRIRYTLRYDFSLLPEQYSWQMVEGDLRAVEGEYVLRPITDNRTDVTYRLRVDLGMPLPRFVLRQAERLVLRLALRELKAYVEAR